MRLVDESLFTETPEGLALLGSRCADCEAHTFPRQSGCPRCTGSVLADVPLARTGVLWSWTVQGFRPKPPYTGSEAYEPYGVGYVELPGQLIVETRLVESDPGKLRIGMPVELAFVPFRDDDQGQVHTFAFVEAAHG
ncbi:Zn-ribbon domain-containing OB-fold protein [Prauserella cavernicola]|uniref:OB-fold domain-containing protein n=1 Tax=Prauserella cavernicola TaxID=2800127 RepID=A0A934QVP8_9PSEU|nr:OB-fold domain-containing protein [Prauserella cavernicola]MBK1787416.1 OB-fold domain-containing protein [Prauserella cavernicola]